MHKDMKMKVFPQMCVVFFSFYMFCVTGSQRAATFYILHLFFSEEQLFVFLFTLRREEEKCEM